MDSKRWSGALQHARGQSNKWAAVKNQYLLINFPTLLACKSRRNHVCIGTQLLPASIAPSKPKALTGREAGGAGSSARAKSEKRTGAGSHDGSGNEELNLLFRTAHRANVGVLFCFCAFFFFHFLLKRSCWDGLFKAGSSNNA